MHDDLAAELGVFAAELEREVMRRAETVLAELRASVAERLLAFGEKQAELMRSLSAVTSPADGLPGPPGEKGEAGAPGFLREVKDWQANTVFYAGDLVFCGGSTWQARCDTAELPGTEHWGVVAARGSDGKPLRFLGKHVPDVTYRALDVAMLDGGSFVALQDDPGPCPGDGWRALALRGPRGSEGPRGEAGPRGRDCPPITLEARGPVLILSCGEQVQALDLEPLFKSIAREEAA